MAKKARQIGLLGAVAIGFASMLGAGVFSVFGLAYSNSGSLLLVSLLIAAIVASLNAASIYQLAKRTSRAGGVYSYARVEWNETASFLAGFSFVFGKIGSIAAIGFIFGEYVWPEQSRLVSILAIVALALMNSLGINRTALLAGILALVTTTYLLLTGIAGGAFDNDQGQNLLNLVAAPDIQGTLTDAAIIFFAFAGYARVATLGDEVRDAKKNIPRAIVISLVGVLAIYLISAFALTNTLGSALQEANGSFLKMVQLVLPWMPNWVTIFVASIASLGSMLALLAGISRTAATMAEDRELPRIFAQRNRFGV
jgi:APA family basic amino acid/polyamine antiporter